MVGLNSSSGHVAGAGGLEGPSVEEGEEEKGERSLRGARKMEPFVLFGSSFPKDKEYTQVAMWVGMVYTASLTLSCRQVCRNINQIKICMETGRTVILLNLENLYESLYDLLNQVCTLPLLVML